MQGKLKQKNTFINLPDNTAASTAFVQVPPRKQTPAGCKAPASGIISKFDNVLIFN
jgi:hypothetical protein